MEEKDLACKKKNIKEDVQRFQRVKIEVDQLKEKILKMKNQQDKK